MSKLTIQPPEAWEDGKEGFFRLPNEVYRSAPGIAQSTLKKAMRSPQMTRRPDTPTDKQSTGHLFHKLLLEPMDFEEGKSHLIQPYEYPAENGEKKPWSGNSNWCKEWLRKAEKSGLPVLSKEEVQAIRNMVESFTNDPWGQKIYEAALKRNAFEIAAFARDPLTGELLKARMDIVAETKDGLMIADPKTTEDGDPSEFGKTAWRFYYAVQNAFYCNIASLLTGLDWKGDNPKVRMQYATIETKEPHYVDWYKFDAVDLMQAENEWRIALVEYQRAIRKNDFVKINTVKLPRWER